MIWVAWRQHRFEFLLMGCMLLICSAFLLITGLSMAQTFHQLGLDACLAHPGTAACSNEYVFTSQYGLLAWIPFVITALAAIFGVFVGAPLVARELEHGTNRLVWTQNITRLRWLSVKLMLVLGVGVLMFALLFGLLFWMYTPLYQFGFTSVMSPPAFDAMGPVLPASALLALALGIFAGALTRHTVPAMFLMLLLFLVIKFPIAMGLRPNYLPPITLVVSANGILQTPGGEENGWLTGSGYMDANGKKVNFMSCSEPTLQQCGYRSYFTYQPVSRFWLFQWIEAGIYLVFAILALGAATWLVKRRLS